MNKAFAVLSYPNSNNLGDFIQSEAVKQYFKNQIIQELDRDQLHIYKGPKVFVFMNGWFMENRLIGHLQTILILFLYHFI